jgi:hypothetical protein
LEEPAFQKLYDHYMNNPPPRHADGTTGSAFYEAFWKGYDGVELRRVASKFTFGHVAWKAGRDHRDSQVEKCEKCYKEKGGLKLRWIQLYTGHVYHACVECRKDLKGYFNFRKDLEEEV